MPGVGVRLVGDEDGDRAADNAKWVGWDGGWKGGEV